MPPTCPLCRYDLAGIDADVACPECGATPEARANHNRSDHYLRVFSRIYLLAMIPSWMMLGASLAGYIWAHAVLDIHIPSSGLQDGVFPVLDAIGSIVWRLIFPTAVLLPFTLALPAIMAVEWRLERGRPRRRATSLALLALATLPNIHFILMTILRLTGAAPWDLLDWLPD
jgi:hypothetical protein